MQEPDLRELKAFRAVAERRSFAKAALELGLSRPALSETIRNLEDRLGVRLLNRTTRSVAPTEAGERLLARLAPLLDDYRAAFESLGALREKPCGLIRLTVAPPAARVVLAPLLARFAARHPEVTLEISVDSGLVDIVAERFDAGIRVGERVERDMVAVRLTEELRSVVAAAPAYLAGRGRPAAPRDLQGHNCIRIRLAGGGFLPWRFERKGKRIEIAVEGSLIVNEPSLALRAALDGAGVIQTTLEEAAPHIADGSLVALLEDWVARSSGFYLYHPSRRQSPPALQALIAFLRKNSPAAGSPPRPARA